MRQFGGQELDFEEEILSDSDIEQHFPEEDEDELAEQLGAGLLGTGGHSGGSGRGAAGGMATRGLRWQVFGTGPRGGDGKPWCVRQAQGEAGGQGARGHRCACLSDIWELLRQHVASCCTVCCVTCPLQMQAAAVKRKRRKKRKRRGRRERSSSSSQWQTRKQRSSSRRPCQSTSSRSRSSSRRQQQQHQLPRMPPPCLPRHRGRPELQHPQRSLLVLVLVLVLGPPRQRQQERQQQM